MSAVPRVVDRARRRRRDLHASARASATPRSAPSRPRCTTTTRSTTTSPRRSAAGYRGLIASGTQLGGVFMAMTATPLRQARARRQAAPRPRHRLRHPLSRAGLRRRGHRPALDGHRRRLEREPRRLDHAPRGRRALGRASASERHRDAAASVRPRARHAPMILDDDHRAVQDAVRAYVQDRDRAERGAVGSRQPLPARRAARPGRARLLRRRRADRATTAPASTTSRSPSSSRRSPPATARPRPSSASTTARSARS